MSYIPEVNDYVQWKQHEGWVYFKCDEYITIEIGTNDKNCQQLINGTHHKKDHILLVCHYWCWNEVKYVKTRNLNHEHRKDVIQNMENKVKKSR